MQRTVTITILIDPTEYAGAEDTDRGAVELAEEMVKNRADWPETPLHFECGKATRTIQIP